MHERRDRLRKFGICVAMAAVMSCVRLDEGHCIINGGDFACDGDRMCVTEIESVNERSDRGDGCIRTGEFDYDFDAYFVHVKYGLPESLRSRTTDAAEDVRSVTGVLVRAAEERGVDDVEECEVREPVVRQFEEEWREVEAVRTFLDRRDRVRAESAALEPFQVEAIDVFNEAIDEWLDDCQGLEADG